MKKKIKYLIRNVRPEDYLSLHRVYYETWLATYPNKEHNITVEDIKYKYEEKLKPEKILEGQKRIMNLGEKELMILLEYSGEVIGICNTIEREDFNQLQSIYVLPKYQGLGLGYALWTEGKKIFNPKKDIVIHVASYNEKAINFYRKLGFESTGKILRDEKYKLKNGAIIPELEMIIKT